MWVVHKKVWVSSVYLLQLLCDDKVNARKVDFTIC